LDAEAVHEFRFSGLPDDTLLLQMHVPIGADTKADEFRQLSTTFVAAIVDDAGNQMCGATGTPMGTLSEDHWWLMSTANDAAYWHEGCTNLRFSHDRQYTLRIEVQSVDPKSPGVTMNVMLEGGGYCL